jgi:hypothetical protein
MSAIDRIEMTANIDGKEIPLSIWLGMESYQLDEDQENERLDFCYDMINEYIENSSQSEEDQAELYIPHPHFALLCLSVLFEKTKE